MRREAGPGLALLVLLLALPSATAGTPEIVSYDEALVDQPLPVLIGIPDATSPTGYAAHADIPLEVRLNGHTLLATAHIHEHDGHHEMIVTPTQPGLLEIIVGDHVKEIPVVPGLPLLPEVERVRTIEARGAGYDLRPIHHHGARGHDVWDLRWSDGMPAVQVDSAKLCCYPVPYLHTEGAVGVHGFSSIAADGPYSIAARAIDGPDPTQTRDTLPKAHPWAYVEESCDPTLQRSFLLDPDPMALDPRTYPVDTALRVHALPHNGSLGPNASQEPHPTDRWTISLWGPGPVGHHDATANLARGGTAVFSAPAAGAYQLRISEFTGDHSARCDIPIQFVPNSDLQGPGQANLMAEVTGPDTVTLRAEAHRGGALLGHYEFDLRVYHLADHTDRLAWKGKLHGHGGSVEAELGHLKGGDYRVHLYPSPQDQGTPRVATEAAEGWTTTFTVEGYPEPGPVRAEAAVAEAPMPAIVLLVVALLALAARSTRRLRGAA